MTDTVETDEALVFECDLEAPVGQVWRALTVPELRAAWLGEAESEACRVVEAAPGERLVVGWPDDGRESTVTFEIEADEAGGTRLRIVHSAAAPTAMIIPFRPRAAPTAMAARTTMSFRRAA
jgi:uncharacterized protein YndB with AHSA1/START domain